MVQAWQALGLGIGILGMVELGSGPAALAQPTEPQTWQSLQEIFGRENEDQGAGNHNGSRPTMDVCLITPRADQPLWHRNPMLVWQGPLRVGLRPAGEPASVFWQDQGDDLDGVGAYQAYYPGEPLKPEQGYEWLFYLSEGAPTLWVNVQTMATEDYEHHATELAELQHHLTESGANETEIAQAQAVYFVDNNLSADALQVIFFTSAPSADLLALQTTLIEEICSND